jgi:hypothetical protein
MNTIFKYPLVITDEQKIKIPQGAVPLYVEFDGTNTLCLWCQVNTTVIKENCIIYIVGTGNPMPDKECEYIGSVKDTFTYQYTTFIWHVFIGI